MNTVLTRHIDCDDAFNLRRDLSGSRTADRRTVRRRRGRHGGVDWYLADCGVERSTVESLRDALLEH